MVSGKAGFPFVCLDKGDDISVYDFNPQGSTVAGVKDTRGENAFAAFESEEN